MLLLLSFALGQECEATGREVHGRTYEDVDLGQGELQRVCLRGEVDLQPVVSPGFFLEQGDFLIIAEADDRGCAMVCVPAGSWRATVVNGSVCLMGAYREAGAMMNVKAGHQRTWYVRVPTDGWRRQTMTPSALGTPLLTNL